MTSSMHMTKFYDNLALGLPELINNVLPHSKHIEIASLIAIINHNI